MSIPITPPATPDAPSLADKLLSRSQNLLGILTALLTLIMILGGGVLYVNGRFTLYEYLRVQREDQIARLSADVASLVRAGAERDKQDAEFKGRTIEQLAAINRRLDDEREDRKEIRSR